MDMKTRVWSGLGPGKTSTAAPTPVAEAEGAENIDKDETANSSSRESTTSDFFRRFFVLAYMRYRYRGLISSSAPTKIKRPSHTRKDPSHSTSLPNISPTSRCRTPRSFFSFSSVASSKQYHLSCQGRVVSHVDLRTRSHRLLLRISSFCFPLL